MWHREHALMAAGLGLTATGVDAAPTAIGIARHKAEERGLEARFIVADALDLAALGEGFDTVLDCGSSTCSTTTIVRGMSRACMTSSSWAVPTTCCASATGNPATGAAPGQPRRGPVGVCGRVARRVD